MNITAAQIKKIRESYDANKTDLKKLEVCISANGITDDGISDVSASFEQGYNNALEFVFSVLGIAQ